MGRVRPILVWVATLGVACAICTFIGWRYFRSARAATEYHPNIDGASINGAHYMGCGLVVSKAGHILTHAHQVRGADKIVVTLAQWELRHRREARIVTVDQRRDLALLVVNEPTAEPIPFPADPVEPSSPASVFGYAMEGSSGGWRDTLSSRTGAVVPSRRPGQLAIQAPLNPGFEGGPVFDAAGRLLGMANIAWGSAVLSRSTPVDATESVAAFLHENDIPIVTERPRRLPVQRVYLARMQNRVCQVHIYPSPGGKAMWRIPHPRVRWSAPVDGDDVTALAASPDGLLGAVAILLRDGRGRVDVRGLASSIVRRSVATPIPVLAVEFVSGGSLAVMDARGVHVWDIATQTIASDFGSPDGPPNAMAVSPDGSSLALHSPVKGVTIVWDVGTSTVRLRKTAPANTSALAFSSDSSQLLLAGGKYGEPGAITIWDVATGAAVNDIAAGLRPVRAIDAAQHRLLAASCDHFGSLHLLDLGSMRIAADLTKANGLESSTAGSRLRFSTSRGLLLSGDVLLDAATGGVLWRFGLGNRPIAALGASGDRLVGRKSAREIAVWDLGEIAPWR